MRYLYSHVVEAATDPAVSQDFHRECVPDAVGISLACSRRMAPIKRLIF